MGNRYEILAAKYPFKGYYEDSCQCDSLLAALWHLIKYQRKGYGIINLQFRNIKEIQYD